MEKIKAEYPSLEPRFLPPPRWGWGSFEASPGQRIRFGHVMPQHPDAVVVIAEGLSEFCEKYFEVVHDLLYRNIGVFIMDWQGQGLSHRHLPNPHMRFTYGFDEDISDFHQFVTEHVRPMTGNTPLVLLAHSMGGNLGLRYVQAHPGIFSCAAFSAPMLGIFGTRTLPFALSLAITALGNKLRGQSYAPGGGDWRIDDPLREYLSSDPVRQKIQDAWYTFNPELQLGGVSWRWLYEAEKSCAFLQKPQTLRNIDIPCLFATAGVDILVDSKATQRLAARIKNAKSIHLADSRHEILLERDDIRNKFFTAFDEMIDQVIRRK